MQAVHLDRKAVLNDQTRTVAVPVFYGYGPYCGTATDPYCPALQPDCRGLYLFSERAGWKESAAIR